jgi:uncharacterized protein YbjT (DUF2867 family)
MYVILGATGNTGSRIAENLLAKGQKVRAVGRSADKLAGLVSRGAEPFTGSVDDAAAMTRAFTGAKAVYALIPPSMKEKDFRGYQKRITEALGAALEKSGVQFAVTLSSFGAELPSGTGPIAGLHELEERLNQISALNALHLRAAFFMENHLQVIGLIKSMGIFGGTIQADTRIPMVATRDIGDVAADALLALSFSGKSTRDILGQRDISHQEAAPILGAAIGKPNLRYSQVPNWQAKMAMAGMGLPGGLVDLILEMNDAISSGKIKPTEARSAQNTTPTSIEQFATEVFAPAFQGKAASA